MSLGKSFAFAASIVVALAACGGTVTEGNGGGDGGGGGGGDGGGGGGGGGTCTVGTLPGDRACVPGTARSNTALAIDIAASEGCLGCFTTFQPCQVDVSGTTITIAMKTRVCPPPGDQACPAICALPQTKCELPPLAAGTYTIAMSGERPSGRPPRTLVVTDDATSTSCTLPSPGDLPKPLDGTKYATSCSVDADCALATVGEICAPCKCPNLAIATSSLEAYGADYRARSSECAPDEGALCAACPPVKATCKIDGTALTGTCEVESDL